MRSPIKYEDLSTLDLLPWLWALEINTVWYNICINIDLAIAVVIKDHHTTMRNHMPYGITQCYLIFSSSDFPIPAFIYRKLILNLATQMVASLSWPGWPGWCLHPKILHLPNMVRNNQAVSWLGVEPISLDFVWDVWNFTLVILMLISINILVRYIYVML